jgi:hypothetical protein
MCVVVVFIVYLSMLIQAFNLTMPKHPVAPVASVFSKASAIPQELCLAVVKNGFKQSPQWFFCGHSLSFSGAHGNFLFIFCQAVQIVPVAE